MLSVCFFFFKQKTAYELRISDWSSDVCSSDLHVAIGIGIDGGFDEIALVAMPLATRNDASTFLLARFEETQHAVELLVRNERPHVVALVEARTDLDLLRAIRNRSEYLVERRLVYIETGASRADLTLIVENACSRTRARSVKISVGQHDHGRLAAQFQRDLLQISGRGLHDQLAQFGGTGARKSTRLNSSHSCAPRLPSSACKTQTFYYKQD